MFCEVTRREVCEEIQQAGLDELRDDTREPGWDGVRDGTSEPGRDGVKDRTLETAVEETGDGFLEAGRDGPAGDAKDLRREAGGGGCHSAGPAGPRRSQPCTRAMFRVSSCSRRSCSRCSSSWRRVSCSSWARCSSRSSSCRRRPLSALMACVCTTSARAASRSARRARDCTRWRASRSKAALSSWKRRFTRWSSCVCSTRMCRSSRSSVLIRASCSSCSSCGGDAGQRRPAARAPPARPPRGSGRARTSLVGLQLLHLPRHLLGARLHLQQLRAHPVLAPAVERRQLGPLPAELGEVQAVLLFQPDDGVVAALRTRAHKAGVEPVLLAQAHRLAVQEGVVLQHLVHALLAGVQLLREQLVLALQEVRALRQLLLGVLCPRARLAPGALPALLGRHGSRPGGRGRVKAPPPARSSSSAFPSPRPNSLAGWDASQGHEMGAGEAESGGWG